MQKNSRYRILLVCSHPVQYASPLFRQLVNHPNVEIKVAYCSLQGEEEGLDPEFGCHVKWDVPLLDGYPWTQVKNWARRPGLSRFWGLLNLGLWRLINRESYDAVVIYTGYRYASFWIALAATKCARVPVLFGTDGSSLQARDGAKWKALAKRYLWPWFFRTADQVIVPSTATINLMLSLGFPNEKLTMTPFVVDNLWWESQTASLDREVIRAKWRLPADSLVVAFCGKLQPWKRPLDVLRAFAKIGTTNSFLLVAGDGPLRKDMDSEAMALSVADRVRMLGFVNQTELPSVYRASDVFVLPSEYEPFGLVVNEAMLCKCAVAVSDRVGAGPDLVQSGITGLVFPCGDIESLAQILRHLADTPALIEQLGVAASKRMQTWSFSEHISGLLEAIERAIAIK
jgi:glycosyltransferase involved in cell wall biosynthesis